MLFNGVLPSVDTQRQTLRDYYRKDEDTVINELLPLADMGAAGRARVWQQARELVVGIRSAQVGKGGVDALLNEFALSTEEGIVLMCLAEALLRVPDKHTMDCLIRDKLISGDWASHLGNSDSLFVNASAWGLLLTGKVVSYADEDRERKQQKQIGLLKKTVNRLGEPVIRAAVRYAMQIMGSQFVMGKTISAAIERAQKQEAKGYCYSYDMLGEGARTMADADRYFQSYKAAIEAIGKAAAGRGPINSPGISVKLSAIHPRYAFSHRDRVIKELVPRLKALALAAKAWDIGLTVDAEEADRLDLSLDIIEAVFADSDLDGWEGFGLAVQAYQKRALHVVDWVTALASNVGRKVMVRLVKGAYWDSEIKWSQQEGLKDYPVFTRKPSTDVSYMACAKRLLAARDVLYPQFATHNAYTVATILELDKRCANPKRQGFEFQRLHGMGEALYDQIMETESVACRIYAPVGEHADLLAYLVRRLLENGANSSFVNNIVDESVPVDSLLQDPVESVQAWGVKRNPQIPLPEDLYRVTDAEKGERINSAGVDLTDIATVIAMDQSLEHWWQAQQAWIKDSLNRDNSSVERVCNPAHRDQVVGALCYENRDTIEDKLAKAHAAFDGWRNTPVQERAALLRQLADRLESHRDMLIALCVKEAGKSVADGVAEVREAVDFCRYYADRAEEILMDTQLQARGVILCISPWNFPVAIFLGQISAALVAGNTVIAKPAEQTSLVAQAVVRIMAECGFPDGVAELVVSPGKPVGEQLVPDPRIQGVMFTGSTETGLWLAKTLAQRPETDIPLIAETGGQNGMIVDSTALPEQVVDDVIQSGFQSAGQRCSALRVLFLQEEVADKFIAMIKGAMQEISIGDPALLSTDVGPVIDDKALERLHAHREYLAQHKQANLLYACELPQGCDPGYFFAPHLYEISDLSVLQREVFGPVVHVIRYKGYELDQVIDQINATGYGLTLGVHSRIQAVSARVAERAQVGNVYVNRNMIGAVVGVQPFGGHGLSGTGPKAGGPLYLKRLLQLEPSATAVDQPSPEPVPTLGENLPASNLLSRSALAQLQWASKSGIEKVSVVRRFLSALVVEPQLLLGASEEQVLESGRHLIEQAEAELFAPKPLPGPTGESNQLLFESRGVVALLMDADADTVAPRAIEGFIERLIAGLLSDNGVVALVSENLKPFVQRWLQCLIESGLPQGVLALQSLDVAKGVLSDAHINAVLLAPDSSLAKTVQQVLVNREGALVPMIQEDARGGLLMRLVVEKTVTIDTTAAGGNASLMTMSGG